MSVLVVDDQPLNRVLLGKLLRSLGLHVIEACDGREGLATYLQYGRRAVAFIFLDLMMPVLDGFNAAISIRSAENSKGWMPVPIVAFTSEDVRHGSPMWQQCMRSGFNDVVPKPMNKRHATQLLCRWLPGLQERTTGGGSGSSGSSDEDTAALAATTATGIGSELSWGTGAATSNASNGPEDPLTASAQSGSSGGQSSPTTACSPQREPPSRPVGFWSIN